MIRHLAVSAALLMHSAAMGGELPTQGLQIIKPEDGRQAFFLKEGDVLQIILPNNSGNFAQDVTVKVGKSPLKLIRAAMQQQGTDAGQFEVGGADLFYLFEATKVGKGELEIAVKRMFDREDEKPFRLQVNVTPKPADDVPR